MSTKIEVNHNRIRRIEDLDELAAVLCPGNKIHQRVLIAIFVELKWAEGQFLPTLEPLADKNGFSRRTLETVRAKMRRLGIIDHVSRFNRKHGYREGWVFSRRFDRSMERLTQLLERVRERKEGVQQEKDRAMAKYI